MATKKKLSLVEDAYTTIKTRIVNLTYPPGMPLTETKLSQDLGMSRNPVRTALELLKKEGLIESDYYKSMSVKEITDDDILELYQLREIIEWDAFHRIFLLNRHEEYSYRIEEKVIRMCACKDDPYAWEVADMDMHMEIISILNNKRIEQFYCHSLAELIRIGLYSLKGGMDVSTTNEHLKKMIQHMRKGQYEKAFAILKEDHFIIGKNSAMHKTNYPLKQ